MKKLYQGKKVLIWGLGLHGGGLGSALYFARLGAEVLVTDLKPRKVFAKPLQKLKKFKNIHYVFGEHREKDFIHQDIIVVGQGVPDTAPLMKVAKHSGAQLVTDVEIFFKACKNPIFAVTGTKGKTTTTMLLYAMMQQKWKTYLGGNVRISMLETLQKLKPQDRVVLELSSFQLESLHRIRKSPHGAIVTNLSPDHLDRYGSLSKYFQAKYSIFQYQTNKDFAVLNYETAPLRAQAKKISTPVYWFSNTRNIPRGVCQEVEMVVFKDGKQTKKLFPVSSLPLPGTHNMANVFAATALAFVAGVPAKKIEAALKNFQPVSGRMEKVRVFKKRTFINDTTATVPISTIFALKSFQEKVVLICGGSEKNLSFKELVRVIGQRVRTLVLMNDKASYRILKEMQQQKIQTPYVFASSMKEAVRKAYKASEPGETVILSPACASFGLFKNEFDRGDQFRAAVKSLK